MKIGYRTIKTAVGTPIAISIAQFLGLENHVTAGILTMLCIQPSRKQSVVSAWDRFLASIIASLFSFFFFEIFGYNTIVLGVMLAFFIPTTVMLNVTQGITTSSVIIINLYSAQHIDYPFLFNQFMLIFVGIGVGLLVNLYMPSLDRSLKLKQKELEHYFQVILFEIALYIRNKNMDWDGKELVSAKELLEETLDLAELDRENHLLRSEHTYYEYFVMRRKQFLLLEKMLPLVTKLPNQDGVSEQIADFFEKLSEAVHPGNTAIIYLDELERLREQFLNEELPETEEEFTTRANLFRLLHDIEDYLLIKKRFKKSDSLSFSKRRKKTGQ